MALLVGLSCITMLTGCFDTRDEFTLNPDGSGKVIHECRFDDFNPLLNDKTDAEGRLTAAVRRLIRESRGVEAWRDVSFKRLDDGRIYFRGTAYFRRLDELEIKDQAMMNFAWKSGPGGERVLTQRPGLRQAPLGRLSGESKVVATNLTAGDLASEIRKQRAQWDTMKPMMEGTIGKMKQESIFHVPGKVRRTSNFENRGGQLRILFDGAKLVGAMDTVLKDDALMREALTSSNAAPGRAEEDFNGILFGQKGPVEAVVEPGTKPLFDYAAELDAAQEDFAGLQKQLEVAVPVVVPATGGSLKSIQVIGVRLRRTVPGGKGFSVFDAQPGLVLSLLGEFPGTVQELTEDCAVDRALCDDGSSLLPDDRFGRQISTRQLSSDHTGVIFDVRLKEPGPGARFLHELTGHLRYQSEIGVKEIDLGFETLREGARGSELGASIKSITSSTWGDNAQRMELDLNARSADIKAVYLVAGDARNELRRSTVFQGQTSTTLGLTSKWAIPANGRIVVQLVGRVQPFDVPFELHDLPLPRLPAELSR